MQESGLVGWPSHPLERAVIISEQEEAKEATPCLQTRILEHLAFSRIQGLTGFLHGKRAVIDDGQESTVFQGGKKPRFDSLDE